MSGSYTLVNAEERAARFDDFVIPGALVRAGLKVGQSVEIVFMVKLTDGLDVVSRGERMWVAISEVSGGRYVGKLENKPMVILDLKWGDEVRFGPEHVCDVWEEPS